MSQYAEVCEILKSKGWPANTAPAPEATAVALASAAPAEVAALIDLWVTNVVDSTEPPPGIVGWDAFRRWVIHRTFAIGREFWEYGTALAFGQIVEPPVDKIREAKSVSEWLRNQSLWRNRLGYVLLDHTPEGEAEMARRQAKALDVPLEWVQAGKQQIWALAVIEGLLPVTLDALSAAYAARTPSLAEIRDKDAQQWLDSLRGVK